MKRHPRTAVQVLAVAATAVTLGLSASPALAADVDLGNVAQAKLASGNGKTADVQVPGLNTGATVGTGNGVDGKVSVGGSGGTNVNLHLGGTSGGTTTTTTKPDDGTPQPVDGGNTTVTSTPSDPTSPGSPSTPPTVKSPGKPTVKKVVKRLGSSTSGQGQGAGSSGGGSGGSTTTTYLTGSGSSASGRPAKAGTSGAAVTARVGTTGTGSGPTGAGEGLSSSALTSSGDRLTNGGGHSGMFWALWLVLAGAVGSAVTFLAVGWRRRHRETVLGQAPAAPGEELAAAGAGPDEHPHEHRPELLPEHLEEHPHDHLELLEERGEEKELVSVVPGLAPPRRF